MTASKQLLYSVAWLMYILLSFSLFPFLRVTVLLLSIPLVMLGGWFYRYKGALLTSLLTIPVHAAMLIFHNGVSDPLLLEAVNPLGISSQLFFGLWTALLKINRNRLVQMNTSLAETVDEQTKDLRLFTEYLMDIGEIERSHVLGKLLNVPKQELTEMLRTSRMLEERLQENGHPGYEKARTVTVLINNCLNHLKSLGHLNMSPTMSSNFEIGAALKKLTDHLQSISGNQVQIHESGDWNLLTPGMESDIYYIVHEALTNAVKHADPNHISIGTEQTDTYLEIYIENDGAHMQTPNKEGMGLSLMKHRAARIGADFSIDFGPDIKTRINCRIPAGSAH